MGDGDRRPPPIRLNASGLAWLACLVAPMVAGCRREDYHRRADVQVDNILRERMVNRLWTLPPRPVQADPRSRMGDSFNPDREPIPLDDPAARIFQVSAGQPLEFHGWKKRGVADVEDPRWVATMPFDRDGEVVLDRVTTLQLGVTNSREYQTEVEKVYLAALSLTLARFQFQIQPFARQQTYFDRIGAGRTGQNVLTLNGESGFSQNLLSGGQLLVDFTNTLVFDFSAHGYHTSVSPLLINLTQPLLRNAFLRIVTQPLSLQERGVLYAIRDFARYRRGFYVSVAGSAGYLGLLSQLQGIRNTEEILRGLQRNLEEYEELVKANQTSLAERDQFVQQVQGTEFTLVSARATLETSLDSYKIQLGLPPSLPVKLDDSPLKMFELNDPQIDLLRTRNNDLYLSLVRADSPPPRDELTRAIGLLRDDFNSLVRILDMAESELRRFEGRVGLRDAQGSSLPLPENRRDPAVIRQSDLAERLGRSLGLTREALTKNLASVAALVSRIEGGGPEAGAWDLAKTLAGKDFRARFSDLYIAQAQIRVFLIDLSPVDLTVDEAISVAFENRQDLMNARGAVTDSWRNVEFDANQLLAGLNIVYQGQLNTNPKRFDPLGFDAHDGSHTVGLQFDAPLVRLAERNTYVADQINYQRARRAYMATSDAILQQVRLDMRQLALNRRQFEINREQVVTAYRQVEENEYTLRTSRDRNAGSTLLLLQSLTQLLGAKNTLITSWVSYETARMSLFRDLDIMDVDARGVWTNEHFDPAIADRIRDRVGPPTDPAPRPPRPADPDTVGPGDPVG